jgi:hypothetical protein
MRLPEFLFQSADALERGDLLLADVLLPSLEVARDKLDSWARRLESEPHPPGLEGFDESLAEAFDAFFEALDLLELAVAEDVPELALPIKSQTQDALDILRDIEERAQTHHQLLFEELEERG